MKLDGVGPLFKQFQRGIVQQIVEGEFMPGHRLPSEAEFMKRYGLSRQTISKALSELADRGLIERNKRAGTTVSRGFRESFVKSTNDILTEVSERGGLYEYRILTLQIHVNGESRIAWSEAEAGVRFMNVEILHFVDNQPAQHERRFINLATLPEAERQTFQLEPPGQWLLKNAPWSWVRRRITAINAGEEMARLLQLPLGAACVVLERRMYQKEGQVGLAYLTHPGDRFPLNGDVGLASSDRASETAGRPLMG
jgi:GntR family histidine utilization transcriptional repressor